MAKKKAVAKKNEVRNRVTLTGRLSFPKFTAQEAFDHAQEYLEFKQASVDATKPEFQLILDKKQLDRYVKFLDQEIDEAEARRDAGETRNILQAEDAEEMREGLKTGTWLGRTYTLPVREPNERVLEDVSDAAAVIVVKGWAGQDMVQKAIVQSEQEITNPTIDYAGTPMILPIEDTRHELYPGALIRVTVDAFCYYTGRPAMPGISIGGSVPVFFKDADSFITSTEVDEDEMFSDL